VDRIRKTRADVDSIVSRIESTKKEKKDKKPDPIVEAAGKLKTDLDKLERRIWVPYDAVGIQPETDVLSKIFYIAYAFSTWEPPSPTHLEYLRQAENAGQAVLADFNRFFETDVATFRKQVNDANVRLLPDLEKVEVKKP
jgi:hypothetical protein